MDMAEGNEELHPAERFYDNIWLLLGIGIVLPTLIFTVWGIIEIMSLPSLPIVK